MTLETLKERSENAGFQYAFGEFEASVNPPHLSTRIIDTDNFGADNKVWYKRPNCKLDLVTLRKNKELEQKIEKEILYDLFWDRSESKDEKEGIYIVSYFFAIKEEN